jgi:titin
LVRRTAAGAGTVLIVLAGMLHSAAPAFADSPTVPDAPAKPTVTQTTDSLSVAFVAPADGGMEITGYTASCVSNDGGLSGSNTGVSSPIVVGPLSYTHTYTCTVIATNGMGDSSASAASDAIVIATAAPDKPDQPAAEADGSSITLSLDAPNDNGATITRYDADCTSDDGGTEQTATSDSLPVVVNDLSLGNTYACTVSATNAQGTSPLSDPSDPTLIDALAPDAPGQPTVVPDDGTITVSFDAPNDNGSPITEYDADCTSNDGGTEQTGTNDSSPIVVTGLDNGHTYTCTVTATNAIDTSASSDASAPIIPGTPTIVGGTTVTPANDSALVTYGDHVNDAGDAVTSYTATCVSSDGGDPGTATAVDVPVDVTGLTNGATYTCTLYATNSRGDGPILDASDPFSPLAIPATPDAPTVTPGESRVFVSFTAPDDSGDAITSYDVQCNSSDGGTPGFATDVASPIEVDGLDDGNTYTCQVRATNGTGTGLWSRDSSDVVVGPQVPDAPEITDLERGSNSVTISFTTPDDHDSAISSYTVTCTSDDGGTTQTQSDVSSPIEVDGLTNSAYYTCTVDATNDVGTSVESDSSDQFLAAAEPDAPRITHMTRGNNSITVDLLPGNDNGEPVTNYEVNCVSSDGGDPQVADDVVTELTVSNLTNSNTYTCNATATNDMGTSLPSADSAPFIAAQVPDAPVITGVTRGSNSASVAFTTPWNGGIPITYYSVTCESSDGGTTRVNRGSASPINVGYLTNAHTYTCYVIAGNGVGDSDQSDPSDSFVSAAAPRAPVLGALTLGNNAVTVAFTEPNSGGDPVSTFTITCTSTNGGITKSNTGIGSPITVSSLSNLKTYRCAGVATNDIADSPSSTASAAFVAATLPGAPTITTVTRGSNTAVVAFTAPSNGGSAIKSYRVTCPSSDGGTTRTATAASSPITVTTLTNAKTYTCTVTATNAVGTGNASAASSAFVAATPASAPTITGVTQGLSNASVAFSAPASNGGAAITSYKVTCTSSNAGATRTNTGASSPIVVSALTNAKTYTCKVVAVNGVGTGVSSAASSSFVAANVPDAPKIGALTRGSNAVTVAFVAPNSEGAAVTSFTVTCTSSNGGTTQSNTGAASPIIVSTLDNAKTYSCSVTATNAMGTGNASARSTFVAAAVPDAPVIVSVHATNGTATITFTPPNTNGAVITSYHVSCISSDGGTTRTANGTHSPMSITGLTVTHTYQCTVTATNAIGTSAPSAASAASTA